MALRDIKIENGYFGKGEKILNEFVLPCLFNAQNYDRITGYYSSDSLLAISHGIESLFNSKGKMRLIVGVHSVPSELIEASARRDYLTIEIEKIRFQILSGLLSITDSLQQKRVATLSWMIEDGLLEVKAAAISGEGIFHPKTLIITDSVGDKVVAVGSSNETGSGLGENYEQLMVAKSWESEFVVAGQQKIFDELWNDSLDDVAVLDISDDMQSVINEAFENLYPNPRKRNIISNVIKEMSKMPSNFFVSGCIPALYIHQERAVIDALSRWPVRVMFSDEVGLGKTFEAAATLVYLVKYCNVRRVMILTPKSVLKQWQDELHEHFGLETWLFDSASRSYISPDGYEISMGDKNPIGKGSPNIILMSAQYARGSSSTGSIFERPGALLPELLILDEAHSARISLDIGGKKKKTRMYKMLESIRSKIPHMILATATPMMKSSDEYHAMLKLLGLPKSWQNANNFNLSLRMISGESEPDLSDCVSAGILVLATIKYMNPSFEQLTYDEKNLMHDLDEKRISMDNVDFGNYIKKNWNVFKSAFIKLHPGHLLTIRNTRRALSDIGYKFPKRNLHAENIYNTDRIEMFYNNVDNYLAGDCFLVESILNPGSKKNIGFVRISYRQRVASSLHACVKSLERRFEKMTGLHSCLKMNRMVRDVFDDLLRTPWDDDIDSDELLSLDNDQTMPDIVADSVDINELKRAVSIEYTALESLIKQANELLKEYGDPKIDRSIEKAIESARNNDSVLLFSRYADTVDALIAKFETLQQVDGYGYGVYTGSESLIIRNGIAEKCTKKQIRDALFSKIIRIVFCSDAASEGLNLQAARVLINVDVPWTPARLEQRIGRVARLGQVADEVDIYNVWYPHSVEAKMYKRIQARLDETNITIGEFPEIVADNIKHAILNNLVEDINLRQLKDIRNSTQVQALEQLWNNKETKESTSDKMRSCLMKLSRMVCNHVYDSNGELFELPDGSNLVLTEECGKQESISLSERIFDYRGFEMDELSLAIDKSGNPSAFIDEDNNIVSNISVLEKCLGASRECSIMQSRPVTLPNHNKLDLRKFVDEYSENAPDMWPPEVNQYEG